MIRYRYDEEKLAALYFADLLNDELTRKIIEAGTVANRREAIHLSKFYWHMVDASAAFKREKKSLPFEGSSEYWCEKLDNSLGGYLERAGYKNEWNAETDNADDF